MVSLLSFYGPTVEWHPSGPTLIPTLDGQAHKLKNETASQMNLTTINQGESTRLSMVKDAIKEITSQSK